MSKVARAVTHDLRKAEANSLLHVDFVHGDSSMRVACCGMDRAAGS
jgi:hypothetical protein